MAGSLPDLAKTQALDTADNGGTEISVVGAVTKAQSAAMRIGIVSARWNWELVGRLLNGAQHALDDLGIENVTRVYAPGTFELPLITKHLALTQRFDALIAFGVVIRGETTHYELVSETAAAGIAQVSLETQIPTIFGVLAAENAEQIIARTPQDRTNKGYEAVLSAVEMAAVIQRIGQL